MAQATTRNDSPETAIEYRTTEDISGAGSTSPEPCAFFNCPECGEIVAEWCDCPACLWYDAEAWADTMFSLAMGVVFNGERGGVVFVDESEVPEGWVVVDDSVNEYGHVLARQEAV